MPQPREGLLTGGGEVGGSVDRVAGQLASGLADARAQEVERRRAAALFDAGSPAAPGEPRRRVLVADDNADMRAYLRRVLAERWTVETARDGVEALEAARASPPDLVLTDVMMPRLDGLGLLRALREGEETRGVPVIVLSARAGEESRVEGLEAGADDYLIKPFSSRELVARVAVHLQIGSLRREVERALLQAEEARARAELASRAKDEFLALLGHELRNPLAPITTALHLMRVRYQGVADKERGVIERQVAHLTRLVDDLLDVSRITRGKIELKRQRVELSEVVARAVEAASPLFEQRSPRLVIDVPARGLAVDGDATRLTQAVVNLLNNAAKYSEAGGRTQITARREDGLVALRVRDEGIGIDPDVLPRIFDLFVQERQALDRSQGGLGLGLAIVRSLVEMHGGSVQVHSAGRGQGSELTIRLPAVGPDDPAPVAAIAPTAPPAAGSLRILVVDDNHDAAALLGESLSILGHTVRVAGDGPSALRIAEELAPDVALLDIGLPVMDGYELARRLRVLPALAGVRLIAVTGYGQPDDRRRSREAGFDAHVVKPVELDVLRALVVERPGD